MSGQWSIRRSWTDLGDDEFTLSGAGTGPWQFTDFDPATQLVMTPNPNYWDGDSPSLTELTWLFLTGPDAANAALDMYKQGKAISADVPLSLLDRSMAMIRSQRSL